MDLETIVEKFKSPIGRESVSLDEAVSCTTKQVRDGKLKIVELVQMLNPILTNIDHAIRLRGVEIMTKTVTVQSLDFLTAKEIEVLTQFMLARMLDHQSMELPSLSCVKYLSGCVHKDANYDKDLLDFLKTSANVQKLESKSRLIVYEIVEKMIVARCSNNKTMDSDLLYSFVHLIEGENNPQNLLTCFKIVSYILKNFDALEPYIDDLFEWLSNYFPVDYTPGDDENSSGQMITRSDLVEALYDCFFCNPLNAENLQTLLLESLESNSMSTKLEALECLTKCYESFPLSSIKSYASSLWTAIRTECLKKFDLVDPRQLESCYRALHALSKKLGDDDSLYFSFVSDVYEELAIAFRKPEMDLFEPSMRLVVSIIQSKLSGANYILDKVLPLSINAIKANELRPIGGLTYLFRKISEHHKDPKLLPDLEDGLNKLGGLIVELLDNNNGHSRHLLLHMLRCKVSLKSTIIESICSKLLSTIATSPEPEIIEDCLVIISTKYRRPDIISCDDKLDEELDFQSLLDYVDHYNVDKTLSESKPDVQETKLSIYLRHMMLTVDAMKLSEISAIDQELLSIFLTHLRDQAIKLAGNTRLIDNIGKLHCILLNKLDQKIVEKLTLQFFASQYCTSLMPADSASSLRTSLVYIPIIKWIIKALVVRNHRLFEPMVNLVLNLIGSASLNLDTALQAAKTFSFAQEKSDLFVIDKDYQVFTFHGHKLYSSSLKEIKLRHEKCEDDTIRSVLICAVVFQLPHLAPSIYRRDLDWLLREIIKILTRLSDDNSSQVEGLALSLFDSIDALISKQTRSQISGLMSSLVDRCLAHSQEAKTVRVRRQALRCLRKIAQSFDASELLIIRQAVIQGLKACLADKKRLVRQAAAEARLTWTLIGQPIGS